MPGAIPPATKMASLELCKAEGQFLEEPTLVLLETIPDDLGDVVLPADVTAVTFTGYSDRTALAFGSAHKATDGKYKMTAPSQFYEVTADPGLKTVRGYALMNAGKTAIYRVHRFPTPIILSLNLGFDVVPEFVYGE